MKCLCNFVSVVLVLVVSLLSGSPAKAGTPISTCGFQISQPGEYDLETNIGPCNGDGIVITASDVTLHLNGYTITGTPNDGTCNGSFGILVFPPGSAPLSHVRVLGDGTIRNFFVGFLAENSKDSSVKFTTVTAKCPFYSYGFYIFGGSHWKLQGNVVRENVSTFGSAGIFLASIDDNHVVANDVNDTILLANSSNNVIANNIADDSQGPTKLNDGIFIGGNNNEIHANTTNNNDRGIEIGFGSGNKVTGNYSFANLIFDMQDDNPGCDSNKWRGNHFGKANQPCIRSGKDDDSGEDEDRKDDDRG